MTPYVIQSNIKHPDYEDATIKACARARQQSNTIGVFQDRAGAIHVQEVSRNSLRYFGRNGLLFVADAGAA